MNRGPVAPLAGLTMVLVRWLVQPLTNNPPTIRVPPPNRTNTRSTVPLARSGPQPPCHGPLSPLPASWPALANRWHHAGALRMQSCGGHDLQPTEQRRRIRSHWSGRSKWRPGGHRARRGRRCSITLVSSARPVRIVHTCAPMVRTSPSPLRDTVCERGPGSPERRCASMMQLCGHGRTAPVEPIC